MLKRIAISIGDLNGIGIELALRNHREISAMVDPIYIIDPIMLTQAATLLKLPIPDDFQTLESVGKPFTIEPGRVSVASGHYSYSSFLKAVELAREQQVDAIITLPIHKKAWELAGIHYKGHTDALRDFFDAKAIMMLGCPQMYVALFTEHIPLREVAENINEKDLTRFLVDFYTVIEMQAGDEVLNRQKIALLGLNPHAGDDGVLGSEEQIIKKSILNAHEILGKDIFTDPLVPDVAFTPKTRANYSYYIAMYHDQGLTPLKALYFDEGINISLNLPILRTSVDHGTAFDIAYRGSEINSLSYLNAAKYIVSLRALQGDKHQNRSPKFEK
ncbi:MAG: 4-hydroxythreonine-4-phosphate dehydrogenase [Campylobacterota bacterium]|nr:4-hydroxythreonine-4-phosphate dehydrogenase [Campylobacterota bacterium]